MQSYERFFHEQLWALGVERGDLLVVHTSFRAVRPIAGGPAGLIQALRIAIGEHGTLVMPSWTENDDEIFDPLTTPAARSLGVVADTFWRFPGVLRSGHPFACAASGPLARQITSDSLPIPPHRPESPIGRVHELDGKILLLGVGHDANTTLHLAEVIAEVPYGLPRHITALKDGVPARIDYLENDHCCQNFSLMDGWLRERSLQNEGVLANGIARLARSRDVVQVALEHLRRDMFVFLHPPDGGCSECAEARMNAQIG